MKNTGFILSHCVDHLHKTAAGCQALQSESWAWVFILLSAYYALQVYCRTACYAVTFRLVKSSTSLCRLSQCDVYLFLIFVS